MSPADLNLLYFIATNESINNKTQTALDIKKLESSEAKEIAKNIINRNTKDKRAKEFIHWANGDSLYLYDILPKE